MKSILLAATALALLSAPAFAYTVQSGCSVPPATIAGGSWYVNPTAATGGAGTQAAPFNTIAAAVAAAGGNGGTINLMSGNYGDVAFNYGAAPISVGPNANWLLFVDAPGQTPVMTTLVAQHVNKMIFDGITVRSQDNNGDNVGYSLVNVVDQGASGTPNQDIILANLQVSSVPTLTGLTQGQLASQLRRAGIWAVSKGDTLGADVGTTGDDRGGMYSTCVSMSGNHVFNVWNGIVDATNSTLITGNQVDHYADNGIAIAANNLNVNHNNIHDVFNNGDNGATGIPSTNSSNGGASGIEGWFGPSHPGVAYNQFSNIVIDSNTFIRQLDPALPFPAFTISAATPSGSPQGIVGWANPSDWWNLTITNNVIVTQGTCNGIYFPSLHNSLIANNTVAEESSMAGGGCPDVQIQAGEGTSSNVRISANIAPEIWQWAGATINNNAATCNYDIEPFCAPINLNGNRKNQGDITTLNNAGHGSDQVPQGQFRNFVPQALFTQSLPHTFDLHLSAYSWMVSSCDNYPATSNSFACNATSFFGRSVPGISPALDIEGKPRFGDGVTLCTIPVPGAYSFPTPCSTVGSGPVPLPPPPPAAPPPLTAPHHPFHKLGEVK